MDKYGFVHKTNEGLFLGVMEGKKLIIYRNLSTIEGNIYRGRVINYIKPLNGYVVDIGEELNGLLKANHAPKNIKASDDIIVEVLNESKSDKLHDLTSKYSITDGFIVLSKDLNSEKYNMFLRTKGKELDKEEINKLEIPLSLEFEKLLREKNLLPTPKLLRKNRLLENLINSSSFDVISSMEIDGVNGLKVDKNFNPIFDLDLSKALSEIVSSRVTLEHGIELVFDKTEACTVIDINSKSFSIEKSKKVLSFEVNYSSLDDLARLISIKNIRNMLIIDFIRMSDKDQKKTIEDEFKKLLKKYNVKSQIYGFTNMGLFEMIVQ